MDFCEEMLEFCELPEGMIVSDDFCETIGNTRRSATALCDFMSFIESEFDTEDFCTAFDDFREVSIFVEIHLPDMPKSVTKWMTEG